MWITRDKDGSLYVWANKPKRYEQIGYWSIYGPSSLKTLGLEIDSNRYSEITWESDPVEVKLVARETEVIEMPKAVLAFNDFLAKLKDDGIISYDKGYEYMKEFQSKIVN